MNCLKIFICQKQLKGEKKMINYNKNKLINTTLDKYYETFSHTLDTVDYVPEKYNQKVCRYIFKNMKKAFRAIDKEDRKYQREQKRKLKSKQRIEKLLSGKKLNFFQRIIRKIKLKFSKHADSNNNS